MLIKITVHIVNINVIQCYAPILDKPEVELNAFYNERKEFLSYTKRNKMILIIVDFNAKVGSVEVGGIVDRCGMGKCHIRGETLTNTCFK